MTSPFETYIFRQRITSSAESKIDWDMGSYKHRQPPRRTSSIPTLPLKNLQFMSDDELQCTLYSTLYSGRFQRKFCESRRRVGTIPYRTVRMISRAGAQRTSVKDQGTSQTANCDLDRRGVH